MGTQPLLTGDNLVYPWSVTILGCPSCIFSHPRFSWVIFVHPSSGLQVFSAVRTCQFDQHISIASLQLLSLKALLQMFAGVRTCHCCFLNIQINCQGTTYLLIMQSILTQGVQCTWGATIPGLSKTNIAIKIPHIQSIPCSQYLGWKIFCRLKIFVLHLSSETFQR